MDLIIFSNKSKVKIIYNELINLAWKFNHFLECKFKRYIDKQFKIEC